MRLNWNGSVFLQSYEKLRGLRCLLILKDAAALAVQWNPVPAELAAGGEVRGIPVIYGKFDAGLEKFFTAAGGFYGLEDLEDAKNSHILLIITDGRAL